MPQIGYDEAGQFCQLDRVSVITLEKYYKQTCNNSSGQTYTQATGLISLL